MWCNWYYNLVKFVLYELYHFFYDLFGHRPVSNKPLFLKGNPVGTGIRGFKQRLFDG